MILSQNLDIISVRPQKFVYFFYPTSEIWIIFPSASLDIFFYTNELKKHWHFDLYDRDGDGHIDLSELQRLREHFIHVFATTEI